MSDKTKALLASLLELPDEECAEIAERLLASLDSTDEELDQAEIEASWGIEAERRMAAYRKGEIESEPGDKVMRELFEKYNK